MKTATIIFRTTPERKELLKKQFEASLAAVQDEYKKLHHIYGSPAWEKVQDHPESFAAWVEICAVEGSQKRVPAGRVLHAAPARRKSGRKGSHE